MFSKFFNKYRITEIYNSKLSKYFFYTEKYSFLKGWHTYPINQRFQYDSLEEAKNALLTGQNIKYHYIKHVK